ncbi:NUDIX domain-containing protein [Thermodesulfobacteriota bacterium]
MTKVINSTSIKLTPDRYGGVAIDDSSIPHKLDEFEMQLIKIISDHKDKKLLWITLPILKSDYIPLLTKYDFIFYDCSETSITLLKRLAVNPVIPRATNHTIGVGAFVIDENEILVVRDRIYKRYKLPGGYIDNKENISQALRREVSEETGISVIPESIVTLGHFSPGQFDESNIYIVCKAKPLSKEIKIADNQEIIEAKWINIDEYLNRKDVHIYNKKIVETAIQNEGIKLVDNDLFSNKNNQHEFFF